MNERYKELAIEAEQWCYANLAMPTPAEWNDRLNRKFAELIVRECASVELYWLSEQDRKAVAEMIKQHFGVEE